MAENALIPIPLPLKGLNTVSPDAPLQSGYARELTNYALYNGRLNMRPAVRTHASNDVMGISTSVHWFQIGSNNVVANDGDIYNITTGSVVGSTDGPNACAHAVKHLNLNLVFGCGTPRDASSPFSVWTFTTIGLTAADVITGCSHKSRLYVTNGETLEYSTVAAVTGTMGGSFPLAELLEGQSIYRMFSVTTRPGDRSQNVLTIFGSDGKVLVYQGDYPGSPTWSLIGNFDMPPPISEVGFVHIDGDVFVATTRYAYWLSDLLSGDARRARVDSPSRSIENVWQRVTWRLGVLPFIHPEVSHAFYCERLDAIVVQCFEKNSGAQSLGDIASVGNEALCFVYFRQYGGWAVWFAPAFFTPALDDGGETYATSYHSEIVKLDHESAIDQYFKGEIEYDIETSWKTPYFQPTPGRGSKVNGLRPYYQNSLSSYLHKVRAIYDYSDYNAPLGWWTQSTVADIPPGKFKEGSAVGNVTSWDHYSPKIPLGGDGGLVSLQISQKPEDSSDHEQTQSIYGAVLSVEPTGENHV